MWGASSGAIFGLLPNPNRAIPGMNSGKIDTSTAAGNVIGRGDSIVGGLVGVNTTFIVPQSVTPPTFPGTFPAGTIVSSNTVGNLTVTTGTGGGAGGLVGANGGAV